MNIRSVIALSIYALFSGAVNSSASRINNEDMKILLFGHDDRVPVVNTSAPPWNAIGQLKTASGTLCTATLVSAYQAITAGHCLLNQLDGKIDRATMLRFIYEKGKWRHEIQDIDSYVDPELASKMTVGKNGWIVPSSAGTSDFGVIILRTPFFDILPIPLFGGDKQKLSKSIALNNMQMTQAGYSIDNLEILHYHNKCIATGWVNKYILLHQCDTLPGDSGSPLLLKTKTGWNIIAIQSSAPTTKNRREADNRAISVLSFKTKLGKVRTSP